MKEVEQTEIAPVAIELLFACLETPSDEHHVLLHHGKRTQTNPCDQGCRKKKPSSPRLI